jgi:hypothetical protein
MEAVMQARLTQLADVLRAAGLTVVEIDGWKTRSRPESTGGFAPVGVLWHHTGDSANGEKYAEWLAKVGRPDLPAPLCHLSIDRQGTVYVIAAGRANHAGVAKASGSVAAGDGNGLYVGVEVQNTGTEDYPRAQYDAMVKVGAALGKMLPCTINAQRAHYETSVTGKWDPGDPDGLPFTGGKRVLDMDAFRTMIGTAMNPPKPVAAERPLAGGILNCRDGRKPADVKADVQALLNAHRLDFLLLQEAAAYFAALSTLNGWRLVISDQCGTAVLVRNAVEAKWSHVFKLGRLPWPYSKGGRRPTLHPRRALVSVVVGGWLRVASVHMVPDPEHSLIRKHEYEVGARRLVRWSRSHNRFPQLLGGDWNQPARNTAPFTPGWFANEIDATVAYLSGNVLYAIGRRCKIDDLTAHDEGGSDHPLLTFTVRPAGTK